ncbi:hypothetical protein H5410_030434 [Solanum commersonii]|uniref:Uncharacterized protein n=1 Tax=Solanum commersonii TaxID=4109 RepID=A0A9J5YHE4_SOLCO|nr:hypothetical protein H5410_030434 [Solanum commersonii]
MWSWKGVGELKASPVSDSSKIHYFWRIPHAPVDLFEESEQHSMPYRCGLWRNILRGLEEFSDNVSFKVEGWVEGFLFLGVYLGFLDILMKFIHPIPEKHVLYHLSMRIDSLLFGELTSTVHPRQGRGMEVLLTILGFPSLDRIIYPLEESLNKGKDANSGVITRPGTHTYIKRLNLRQIQKPSQNPRIMINLDKRRLPIYPHCSSEHLAGRKWIPKVLALQTVLQTQLSDGHEGFSAHCTRERERGCWCPDVCLSVCVTHILRTVPLLPIYLTFGGHSYAILELVGSRGLEAQPTGLNTIPLPKKNTKKVTSAIKQPLCLTVHMGWMPTDMPVQVLGQICTSPQIVQQPSEVMRGRCVGDRRRRWQHVVTSMT